MGMPFEQSKAFMRRLHDSRFVTTYFVGNGIDVGGGPDSLAFYSEMFPLMQSCRTWDKADGDGMLLEGVEDESLDFVHSSHCLEHLTNPDTALENWIRVTRKEGHIVILLPDEDMFEQGVWPSRYSGTDHITSWTIGKKDSWAPKSRNVMSFLIKYLDKVSVQKIELLDSTYFYKKEAMDQTRFPVTECAIEIILRKRTFKEIDDKGRLPMPSSLMFNYKS